MAIQLSAAVRQNLTALQGTADLLSKTQNRLSTGLKVNSALDNPGSFFTAQSLNSRASDLSSLLDDQGQAVQTLKAADEGIQAITKLAEAAKAKANQALQSSSTADRRKFAGEYNELLNQIETLAKDSGYSGKNLLAGTGNDVSVVFNEDGTSKLDISAVDYTDTSAALGLSDLTVGTSGTLSIAESDLEGGDEAGDTLTVTVGGSSVGSIDYGAGTTSEEVITALNAIDGITASTDGTTISITSENGDIVIDDTDTTADLATQTGSGFVAGSFDSDTSINATLDSLTSALGTLRSQASTFGTNLTVVENRQDFTKSMINTLSEGAGKLTLADTNEEGANLLALQTRQTLASTSLSFASQADQNVLRLL
ncbi:flagellin-like hook-associated protein FlgL [Maritalea mobilis]|uniref:Flagellin n=1 Tax=Maritalea mobilis TaxID=483324 RepID=A0A4R6VRM4_9HYPH|nr:flagellin-like hook-associated protein FlgL [Maritalea mobilis]